MASPTSEALRCPQSRYRVLARCAARVAVDGRCEGREIHDHAEYVPKLALDSKKAGSL